MRIAAVLALLAALSAAPGPAREAAHGASLPAAGSAVTDAAARWAHAPGELPESHGWIVVPAASGHALLHLPPRGHVRGLEGEALFARDGAAHQVAALRRAPEAAAAHARRVYLVFASAPGSAPGAEPRRDVLSLDIEPTALNGLWADKGRRGPRTLPGLPSADPILGLAADEHGLLALLEPGPRGPPALLLLAGDGWVGLEPPPWTGAARGHARLLAGRDGPCLLAVEPQGQATVWEGRWSEGDASADARRPTPRLEWSVAARLHVGPSLAPTSPVLRVDGQLCWASRDGQGGVTLHESVPSGPRRLGVVEGVGAEWGVAALAQSGRAVLLWRQEEGSDPGAGLLPRLYACEVSLRTGRVLYRGPARAPTPISPGEVRWLAGGLLALMAVVLAVVLRSEGDAGVATLPEGFALAPAGPRLLAGLIDAAAAVLLSAAALGEEWERAVDPALPARTLGLWGLALAIGFGHATLGEWLTGRSLGKAMTGLRVVRIGEGPDPPPARPPTLAGAIARNGVRWLLAPYAALSVLDPAGRHRGDVIARTAVVAPAGPAPG